MRIPALLAAAALLAGGCSSETTRVNPGVASDTTVLVDISPAMK
jgi:hypothetical protein